jgi:hypothetical protein
MKTKTKNTIANSMNPTKTLLLITITALSQLSAASAAVTITVTQIGPNVVFSGSGSFNLSALPEPYVLFSPNGPASIDPSFRSIIFSDSLGSVEAYSTATVAGPSSYGTGSGAQPDSSSGDNFGFQQNPSTSFDFILPAGYVSNSPLSGTMTFENQTFATLGLAEGTYTWSWSADGNSDSLTLNIPEPTSFLLGSLTFGAAFLRRRRHDRSCQSSCSRV